jgi:hypothetical protein
MITIGRFLLNQISGKKSIENEEFFFEWVDEIEEDTRISLNYGDIANTELDSG